MNRYGMSKKKKSDISPRSPLIHAKTNVTRCLPCSAQCLYYILFLVDTKNGKGFLHKMLFILYTNAIACTYGKYDNDAGSISKLC